MIAAVIATSCAIVWPVRNVGYDHGVRVVYRDMGDAIVYSRPVSPLFRDVVETRRGRSVRIVCVVTS